MSENPRRNDWQVVGAWALIALGALLLLKSVPVFGLVREAFRMAVGFVWPIAIIALGALLLMSARRDRAPFHQGQPEQSGHRLYRSRHDRMIAGVLGGMAQYLGLDATLVRILFAVLSVFVNFWTGVLVYIIGVVLIPEEPRQDANQPQWPGASPWGTGGGWPGSAPGSTQTVQTPPPAPAPGAPAATPVPAPNAPAAPVPPATPGPAPTAADAPPPPEMPPAQ